MREKKGGRHVPNKLLLLDFDGTLCLGEDPILTYADRADAELTQRSLPGPGGRSVREVVTAAFARDSLLAEEIHYDDAGLPLAVLNQPGPSAAAAHPVSWPLQDGYQLVQLLAVQSGLTNEDAGQAFQQARRDLVAAGLENTDLHAPAGAEDLFSELREAGTGVVLVTNSPAEGFGTWLSTLGLQDSFDAVINSAQKPFGMPQAVEQARQASPSTPVALTQILSVGDIWANDLAHPDEVGGSTILIDRFGTNLGRPTHRVPDFSAAVPLILRWAGEPDVNNW